MTAPNLKRWKLDNYFYISPRFVDFGSYDRMKKFLIRQTVRIECDDLSKVIKISVHPERDKSNIEKLTRLGSL